MEFVTSGDTEVLLKAFIFWGIDCVKKFNIYSKYPFCNTLFIKYLRPFRAWGPYEKITFLQWEKIFKLLSKYKAKLTIGVTAYV